MGSRISSYSKAETVVEMLNGESDITHDEVVSAVIGLARHVDRLELEVEKLERQINPDN